MEWQQKTGVGAALSVLGAICMVVLPILGVTEIGRPWSFLLGFVIGVITGLGAVLAVSGLLDRRRQIG
jgi:hypothetical protein